MKQLTQQEIDLLLLDARLEDYEFQTKEYLNRLYEELIDQGDFYLAEKVEQHMKQRGLK